MNLENVCASLQIRKTKLNLTIETTRSEKSRVEGIGSIGCHENLDVSSRVKTVELVDELKHRSLNLVVTSLTVIKTGTSHSVNFIKEDNACLLGSGHLEQLANHSGSFSNIFLYKLATNNTNECGIGTVGNGSGSKCLTSTRGTIEEDSLRGINT
jgi:hypothetical protein